MKKSRPVPSARLVIHYEQASPAQKVAAWRKFWQKLIAEVKTGER